MPECFGDLVLAQARQDLGSSSTYGFPGVFCSAAVKDWMIRAGGSDIAGDPSAKATMVQFQKVGRWLPAASLRSDPGLIQPGMISVWTRNDPQSYAGHIGIVASTASDGEYASIEANAGPKVAEYKRKVNNDTLLGMGYWNCSLSSSWNPLLVGAAMLGIAGITAYAVRNYRWRTRRSYG